jgi:2-phosphoglycerate kinase
MKNQIYLIGGAPGSGKTTISKELSKTLNIPWISTDIIREWMKEVVNKNDYIELFSSTDISAEDYLTSRNIQQIIDDENKQSKEVQR